MTKTLVPSLSLTEASQSTVTYCLYTVSCTVCKTQGLNTAG